jgi:hypothetical protein
MRKGRRKMEPIRSVAADAPRWGAAEQLVKRKNTPFQVLTASLVGTTIEYFDFYVYATAAVLIFPQLFFPGSDPTMALLASFATFSIAFLHARWELSFLGTTATKSAARLRSLPPFSRWVFRLSSSEVSGQILRVLLAREAARRKQTHANLQRHRVDMNDTMPILL